MYKILTCLFLFSTVFLNFSQSAVITKIGFVDFQRIFTEVDFKNIISSKSANLSGKAESISSDLNQINSMLASFELNKPAVSLRESLNNYQNLNSKLNEFTRMADAIHIPPEEDIIINSKIMSMISETVEQVGVFLGYSIVVEKTNIIYGHQMVNITEYVIQALKEKLQD